MNKVINTIQTILNNSRFNEANCKFRTADLEANIQMAEKYEGSEFVLVDQTYGSLIFPVGRGCTPSWMKVYRSHPQANWYHIDANGASREIKELEAMRLIEQLPQIRGLSKFGLLKSLSKMLNDNNVTNSGLVSCSLTTQSSIGEWKRWFNNSGNDVMQSFLVKVEKVLYV